MTDTTTPKPRANRAEVDRRITLVLGLLVSGGRYADAVQLSSENGWDIGERRLRKYIAAATARLRDVRAGEREDLIALHLARRDKLYAMALHDGELATALKVEQDTARLMGLYPPERAEVAASCRRSPREMGTDELLESVAGPNANDGRG